MMLDKATVNVSTFVIPSAIANIIFFICVKLLYSKFYLKKEIISISYNYLFKIYTSLILGNNITIDK